MTGILVYNYVEDSVNVEWTSTVSDIGDINVQHFGNFVDESLNTHDHSLILSRSTRYSQEITPSFDLNSYYRGLYSPDKNISDNELIKLLNLDIPFDTTGVQKTLMVFQQVQKIQATQKRRQSAHAALDHTIDIAWTFYEFSKRNVILGYSMAKKKMEECRERQKDQ